jgi:hypothetical protein
MPGAPMKPENRGRLTAAFEEVAYTNMIVVAELVELLTEKGFLSRAEITDRVKKLKEDMRKGSGNPR